ncbi:phenylacetate-CoA ligase [Methanococcoides vulcani]|uniref:Phenylacetate-CoA ligase n=1 Tax=Methanococcoides vulcani TaxID=1353158 RepID=A0A1H9Z723_9EURY|nr:phenylacetate--CoA ligase family protein [Methanococcoides vulcani]SES77303.1 phenylacetate-CoA ligase [Methanococcoides vulcani]
MIPELAKFPKLEKILASAYDNCPYYLHNLAVSAYGYYYRKQNLNERVFSHLNELEKTQYYNRSDLEEYQNKKLRSLVKHAYENVPYYHRIFKANNLTPDDIRTKDDLVKLPYLTKDDIRHNFQDLIAKNYDIKELQLVHTSGTTGSPLKFYWDKNLMEMENAFIRRHWGWAGFGINDQRVTLRGNVIVPLSKKKKPFWRYNLPEKQVFFSSFHMNNETLPDYVEKIRKISPKAIQGYPSTIYTLARYMLDNDVVIPVDAVFTSSEPIYSVQRETIEKQFQCKIYDLYGLSERTLASGQCSHGNYHIYSEYGIVELTKDDKIIDNYDEIGEIVSTGLNNYGMPLIRYKTGDVTRLKEGECECGRSLPLMEAVETKLEDMIMTPEGNVLSSSVMTHPFKPLVNIERSQIIQESIDRIIIKIVKRPEYSEKDSELLLNEFRSRVGPNMGINLEFVDEISRTKAGKYRWIISKVTNDLEK